MWGSDRRCQLGPEPGLRLVKMMSLPGVGRAESQQNKRGFATIRQPEALGIVRR